MNDYEKLKGIIDEIPSLIDANIPSWHPKMKAWRTKAERFLINKYGKDSFEHSVFSKTSFTLKIYLSDTPDSEFVNACQEGLRQTEAVFNTYLEDMENENSQNSTPKQPDDFTKIFIVHGHDGELKHAVARVIEKQGIEAIILAEQTNQGKTIFEKFEENSDVSCAVCLFTSDDVGKAKIEAEDKPRARQNVVLETGYFMGKLGRERVVILVDKGIELPSDLSGVVYTDTNNWQTELLRELKEIGYSIDFNKLF